VNLVTVSRRLARSVNALQFKPPVHTVYNPLAYARAPHELYLRRFGAGQKQVLLVGMNPGPFGMAQTGVPFGDVAMVRDFMGIEGPVQKPKPEHARRPIEGFACQKSEVSGSRLWGWVRERFGTADRFFSRCFVLNYCPLCFMEESGKNLTPDRLPKTEQAELFAACDRALRSALDLMKPEFCLGVGVFATKRIQQVVASDSVTVGTILHPSPASPKANRGWSEAAEADFRAVGVRW
jgi:single-strand selective monofunctional uracil DNA glycosylase